MRLASPAKDFTFQSGYVQMAIPTVKTDNKIPLHSNLVMFKSVKAWMKKLNI